MRIDSSRRRSLADSRRPSATTWSPGLEQHEVPDDDLLDRDLASRPVAPHRRRAGATSSERRSSARFARTSCVIPIAEFATITPRNSASRQSPKISVTAPNAARISVEHRQHVRPHDARVGAARPLARRRPARGQPPRRLGLAQPRRLGSGGACARRFFRPRGSDGPRRAPDGHQSGPARQVAGPKPHGFERRQHLPPAHDVLGRTAR